MAIWSSEIKELEKLYEFLKGQLPDLEKELEQLIHTADANVIMLYSRRCLEVIITDLCECELNRPRKTEPLKGIIDKLHKEEKVPPHIITSMHGLNELSTYGTHPKDFDPEQIKPVLNNLDIVIKWYLKYKEIGKDTKAKPTEVIEQNNKVTEEEKKNINIPKRKLLGSVLGLFLLFAIVVAALFFTNIIGSGKQTKGLEKSIAVLPFRNDSPVDSNKYFINGFMEEVLNNLQTIKDFRILSRTSTEQYQGSVRPTITEIAKKLGVNYIVEGSGEKYGNNFRIRVQLIRAKGKETHLWANSYEQEIKDTKVIFNIQSQIAQSIADELKAVISPEEKRLIDKIQTTILTAYDFYQRGREELTKYLVDINNKTALQKAEDLFHKALKYDYTFAQAYTGLAQVYWGKRTSADEYYSENYGDSALILCNTALRFDNNMAEAYYVRGNYYRFKGFYDKAKDDYDKSIKINPNSWEAYYGLALLYVSTADFLNCIDNLQKAASLNHGPLLASLLRSIAWQYIEVGFIEKAKYNNLEALKLSGDSTAYLGALASFEDDRGNFEKEIEFMRNRYGLDSTNLGILYNLGFAYSFLGQFKESLKYYKKYVEILKARGRFTSNGMHRIGYAYWGNGYKKEADYYLDKQLEYSKKNIELKRPGGYAYYDIAAVYAFRGDKEKVYENLNLLKQRSTVHLWAVTYLKKDPLFNSIRNEPEFQQIIRDFEAKFQAEHDRVKKWLEETGQL